MSGKDVALSGGNNVAVSQSGDVLLAILAAARDPQIDAAKVETMANLAIKMQDRELAAEFNRDLNAALFEMPIVTKAGIITIPAKDGRDARTQGRFAKFEDIDRVVRPILQRHNLAIRFDVNEKDQQLTVQPILCHINGHTERGGSMRLPLDTSGAKNNVQGAGSAVSYGKRYTMCAMLNIITEGTDDDGSLGKLAITMPAERELLVLQDAEAAQTAGTYNDWFRAQGVKDRGWLVSSGNHARLGGAEVVNQPLAIQGEGSKETHERAAARFDVNTPKGWTDKYVYDCEQAPDLEALRGVQEFGAKGLAKLKTGHEMLFNQAVKAGANAYERLTKPGNDTLFGGNS